MCGCLLDQRISFVFVATVRLFVRDFFSLPMQVDGYGRRGTLQTFRSFPPRRFRRARMPLHPIACAHCIALQTWPRTPPRAPYFRMRHDGRVYFANIVTNETRWAPPMGWRDGWVSLTSPFDRRSPYARSLIPPSLAKMHVEGGACYLERS